LKLLLLALTPDGRVKADRTWEEIGDVAPGARHSMIVVPLLLGDMEAVEEAGQRWSDARRALGRSTRNLDYLRGAIGEAELLAGNDSSYPHYLIGLKSLSRGNREKAREHFQAAVRFHNYWPGHTHGLAAGFFAEMERDPDWPHEPRWGDE